MWLFLERNSFCYVCVVFNIPYFCRALFLSFNYLVSWHRNEWMKWGSKKFGKRFRHNHMFEHPFERYFGRLRSFPHENHSCVVSFVFSLMVCICFPLILPLYSSTWNKTEAGISELRTFGSCSIMKYMCVRVWHEAKPWKRWTYRCMILGQTVSIKWLAVLVNVGSISFSGTICPDLKKKVTELCSISSFSIYLLHFYCHLRIFVVDSFFVLSPDFSGYEIKSTEANLKCNKFVCGTQQCFRLLSLPLLFLLLLLSTARVYGTPTEKSKVICNHLTIHQWYQIRINYAAVVVATKTTDAAAAAIVAVVLPWISFEHTLGSAKHTGYAKRYRGSSK